MYNPFRGMNLYLVLVALNSLAFLYYGLNCLFAKKMVEEFYRFGLSDAQRRLTGGLQILGALGVVTGVLVPEAGLVATAGLTLLMLLGFAVRLKIKDSVMASLPSFVFMALNAYLFFFFFLPV